MLASSVTLDTAISENCDLCKCNVRARITHFAQRPYGSPSRILFCWFSFLTCSEMHAIPMAPRSYRSNSLDSWQCTFSVITLLFPSLLSLFKKKYLGIRRKLSVSTVFAKYFFASAPTGIRERERERKRAKWKNISSGDAIASAADNSTDKNPRGGEKNMHACIHCGDNSVLLVRVFDARATGFVDCDTAEWHSAPARRLNIAIVV